MDGGGLGYGPDLHASTYYVVLSTTYYLYVPLP